MFYFRENTWIHVKNTWIREKNTWIHEKSVWIFSKEMLYYRYKKGKPEKRLTLNNYVTVLTTAVIIASNGGYFRFPREIV